MLFNSGDNSLVAWARALTGDLPTTAPQWDTTTEVKIAVNRAYLNLRERARVFGQGATTKRSYATGVASQIYYQRPADFVKLEAIEVSGNGSNLATTAVASADIIYPEFWPAEKALQDYNTGGLTDVAERFFVQDDHFGIVAPLTATEAGTNSIRILYEASTAELSGDTDEPELPRPHHELISYLAAIRMKRMRDMDASALMFDVYGGGLRDPNAMMTQFLWAMQDVVSMHEDQIAAQGSRQQLPHTAVIQAGTVRRTRGNVDDDVY